MRGPAHLAYAESAPERDLTSVSTIELDDPCLADFAASMLPSEWEESGLHGDLACRYCTVSGDEVSAVAGYVVWEGWLAQIA